MSLCAATVVTADSFVNFNKRNVFMRVLRVAAASWTSRCGFYKLEKVLRIVAGLTSLQVEQVVPSFTSYFRSKSVVT